MIIFSMFEELHLNETDIKLRTDISSGPLKSVRLIFINITRVFVLLLELYQEAYRCLTYNDWMPQNLLQKQTHEGAMT